MNAAEVLQLQYQMVNQQFVLALQELSAGQLAWRPDPNTNSIGFSLWHVLRTWDAYFATMNGRADMYDEQWVKRFGFDVRGRGIGGSGMGTGFTPDDVALVRPQPEALSAYLDALSAQMQAFLQAANDEALGRAVTIPWWPQPVSVARVCAHVIMHSLLHTGEARYLKGKLPQ